MWKVMCMLEKSRMENCDGEHGGSSDDDSPLCSGQHRTQAHHLRVSGTK